MRRHTRMNTRERDTSRPGACLLCGTRGDRLPDLVGHVRTNHSDQTPELMAELMIRIGQLERQMAGIATRA
jgi:hypothetical protein